MSFPPVPRLVDGTKLTEAAVNAHIDALRERTAHLHRLYADLVGAGVLSATKWVGAPMAAGAAAPVAKDIVYFDSDERVFKKALASIDVTNRMFLDTDFSGFAMGIVTYVSEDGETGTVVLSGRLPLEDTDGPWALSAMMESTSAYRNGPLYLSSLEPGKLTQEPAGPAIYVGFFVDAAGSGTGGHALLGFQHKDFFHAHTHRAFQLAAKPAGSHVHTGDEPSGTHTVHGLPTDADSSDYHGTHTGSSDSTLVDAAANFALDDLVGLTLYNVTQGASGVITANDTTSVTAVLTSGEYPVDWAYGDQYKIGDRARLVVRGTYTAQERTSYVCTLTDSGGVDAPVTFPDGFDDVFLKWVSDDPDEGTGLVRITSYEQEVAIGSKGVIVRLENFAAASWSWAPVADDNVERRQWSFTVPDTVRGWLAHREAAYMPAVTQTTDNGHRLLVFGTKSELSAASQTINVLAAKIVTLAYADNPSDGDTLTVGGVTFEFDDDNAVSGSNIRVPIAADLADVTYGNLLHELIDYGFTNVTPVLDTTNDILALGVLQSESPTASISYATLTTAFAGGSQTIGSGNGLLVFDDQHANLAGSAGYWDSDISFYTPLELTNGLSVMFAPWKPDGTAASSHAIASMDRWRSTVVSNGVGAAFVYNVGMHQELGAVYPPIPLESASFTIEGVEQASRHISPDRYVFSVGSDGVYWYGNASAAVPWAFDWVSVDAPGELHADGVLHINRLRTGDSGVVTSIAPAATAPIRVVRRGTGDAATTGDLELQVDFTLHPYDGNQPGHLAVKGVRGNKLITGPVVEKIVDGPGYSVQSVPGARRGQGTVKLLLHDHAVIFGDFETMLRNAKQDLIADMFPVIKFLGWTTGSASNVDSAVIGSFTVPFDLSGSWRFNVFATMFGYADVEEGEDPQFAGFDITYNVLRDYAPSSDYSGTLFDNVISTDDPVHAEVQFGTAGASPVYKAGDPRIVHTSDEYTDADARIYRVAEGPFPRVGDLKSGDVTVALGSVLLYGGAQVVIKIARAASTSDAEYTAPVGLMNLRYQLVAGS